VVSPRPWRRPGLARRSVPTGAPVDPAAATVGPGRFGDDDDLRLRALTYELALASLDRIPAPSLIDFLA
jgi:hypothetical protein